MAERDLSDYVEVAERIQHFRKEFPEGSLRGDWTMIQVGDQHLVAYRAAAYRYPDDKAPGIGCAWELVPGRTPFTRGSELQNAETSAWGRAIIAVGASDAKRGIASRDEVRNRRAEIFTAWPVQTVCANCRHGTLHHVGGGPCEVVDAGQVCGCTEFAKLPRNRDGSTSRSRVTDADLERTGQMTKAELAAHNKLRRDGEPDPQRVEKLSTTPDDDPFYDNGHPAPVRTKPAGWLLSERFAALGVFDRKERLDQCAEIVGRPISSSKELEPGEIAAILEALQRRELAT